MNADIQIQAIGPPQRDLVITMYDRFDPRSCGYRGWMKQIGGLRKEKLRGVAKVASQTAALIQHAETQGYAVPSEWVFQDEGYSGASLARPGQTNPAASVSFGATRILWFNAFGACDRPSIFSFVRQLAGVLQHPSTFVHGGSPPRLPKNHATSPDTRWWL